MTKSAQSERELRAELEQVESQIAQAYWRFTRCARALPPVLAVPQAYTRRRELRERLRELRK